MKRRSFLKNSVLATGAVTFSTPAALSYPEVSDKGLIEWRVYHVSRSSNARNRLNQYFSEALFPLLAKRKVQHAVFNEYGKSEPVVLHVMLGYPDRESYFSCMKDLETDPVYLEAAKSYFGVPASQAAYTRYETFLLETFDGFPAIEWPAEKKGLFEMRLYESASEDAGRRKIAMFNNEEIALFKKTGINPVFFGKIIAGQYMPALIYLVAFSNMEERDAAWAVFSNDKEWAVMRDKPEYADTVSNIQRIFLTPEGV